MKQSTQTLLFIAAALLSILVAVSTRPADATFRPDELIGKPLFAPFEPEDAGSLRIVRFNEESATLSEFEVANDSGLWTLPSKGGYPADAEDQMAEAATGVMDLEVLAIATESAADHGDYGVVEPSTSIEVGQTGVGTRVALAGEDGSTLVDVVVGKEVKDSDGLHFVRRTTQDVVFVVDIDPDDFSTDFADWIEDDLLDLNGWDVSGVRVNDYSSELVLRGFQPTIMIDPRAELAVRYDDEDSEWQVDELLEYDREDRDYRPFELSPEEELDSDALSELKNAVDDLRIVDVERKPSGLSADLRAGEAFGGDMDAAESLMQRGFAPVGEDIKSSAGEAIITLKDGVEYVLRFGNLQLSDSEEAESPEDTATGADPSEGGDAEESGVNRYLFVVARFNEDALDGPELEEVPEASAGDGPSGDELSGVEPSEGGDAKNADDASDAEVDPEADAPENDAAADEPSADDAAAEREAILERNERTQAEYDEKVAESKARVRELNDRFGDWFYVVSDEVFKKIALDRDAMIRAKESPEDDAEPTQDDPLDAGDPFAAAGGSIPGLPDLPETTPAAESADEAAAEEAPSAD
ncbi:MAG: DUF4340 domain-containing protein, partial [Planctomycetota bacterium]